MKRFRISRIVLGVTAAVLVQASLYAVLSASPTLPSPLVEIHPVSRDLPAIASSGALKVGIPTDGLALGNFDGLRGDGFSYDLASRFARTLGLELQVVPIPPSVAALQRLARGDVDLIAPVQPISDALAPPTGWSDPLFSLRPMLLGRNAASILEIRDLRGKTVIVTRMSPFESVAKRWRKQLDGQLNLILIPPERTLTSMVSELGPGSVSFALMSETEARLEAEALHSVRHSAPLGESMPVRWAVRPNAPELQARLAEFLLRSRYSGLIAHLQRRYLENPDRLHDGGWYPLTANALSPFDSLFRQAARDNGLDWHLLAAVASVESGFDPGAGGEGGAAGLLQLMPETAEAFGAVDPYDPAQNAEAGARQIRWLFEQFAEIPPAERLPFVLASYNMGIAHVMDAQTLAAQRGLDPTRWDGNVAEVLPLLEEPTVAAALLHGSARGRLTAGYVSQVRANLETFAQSLAVEPRGAEPGHAHR